MRVIVGVGARGNLPGSIMKPSSVPAMATPSLPSALLLFCLLHLSSSFNYHDCDVPTGKINSRLKKVCHAEKMRKKINFLSAIGISYGDSTNGSILGSFSKISISECDPPTGQVCDLKRGTNATLTVEFIPNVDVPTVTAVVHGIIGSVPIPFNLPNPDGCVESGLECPLQKGKQYTYLATLPVLEQYPKVKVTVKWELTSDKKDLICFSLPAKII